MSIYFAECALHVKMLSLSVYFQIDKLTNMHCLDGQIAIKFEQLLKIFYIKYFFTKYFER